MNYARLEKSPRLQSLRKVLADGKWHTTLDVVQRTSANGSPVCAVNSAVAELRLNGFKVACRPKGRGVYEYKYEGRAA